MVRSSFDCVALFLFFFFFSSRRRHTRFKCDWSSDVCSSDLGLQPPDAKDYLRSELAEVFRDLEQLGFSQAQLRAAALELLHDEEWSPTSLLSASQPPAGEEADAAAQTAATDTK